VLLSSNEKLEATIVRLLAATPRMSAADIHAAARKHRRRFSLAAVYKELTKLQGFGVLVKDGTRFSLSLGWIFDVLEYGERLHSVYFSEPYLKTMLPEAGNKQSWVFHNLLRGNDLWNQIISALLKRNGTSDMFSWVPHPWFLLLEVEKEERLHRLFSFARRRFYTAVGGTTYMDRTAMGRFYNGSRHTVSFSPGTFAGERRRYLDVIGDFVLTVSLDPRTSKRIDQLFATNRGGSTEDAARYYQALTKYCTMTITLENNPRKASRMKAEFFRIFELQQ
jgi:hypothetical protein